MARSINEINPKIDLTVRIFDTFYNYSEEVDTNEYDIVYSFFFQAMKDKLAAQNFTTTLFRIASKTQTPVLTILDAISDQDQLQLNSTLAYYLNGMRSPATLLGINSAVVPNYYAARNVLI
jgi:hypothetical protein